MMAHPAPKPPAGLKRSGPLRRTELKRSGPLRQHSKGESARRRERELIAAKKEAREYWGRACLVPGCARDGQHLHHAYGRGSHPQWRAEAWNLVPLCGGEQGHHNRADRADHWLHDACREIALEVCAALVGRRPRVSRGEAGVIMHRHQVEAEKPHTSPIGSTD